MRGVSILVAWMIGLSSVGALGQTMQDARNDGNTFGQAQAAAHVGVDDSEATAQANVPGYNGANAPQTTYMNNPTSLDATKASTAASNDGYRLTVDGNSSRPAVPASDVKDTVARGNLVSQDPATYAQGLANGSTGQCVQLPPSSTSGGTYEATCDKGLDLIVGNKSCPITLNNNFSTVHSYQCTRLHESGRVCTLFGRSGCTRWANIDDIIGSGCTAYEASPMCSMTAVSSVTVRPPSFSAAGVALETSNASCTGDVAGVLTGRSLTIVYFVGRSPAVKTYKSSFVDLGISSSYLGSSQNVSQCAALASDSGCNSPVDVCTDASPQTRVINGVSITQSCWAWSRTYSCQSLTPANNCSSQTIPQGCTFAREECLDDPAPSDPTKCKVFQEVYTCPIKGPPATKQFVCGGDVYCINGDCEPIVREASTEFADALVGMHTLSEASKSLNKIDYTLFKGSGQACSKPVFGLGNCCGGHGFPLIGSCNNADRLLAKQIDAGITHYVGTYCAKSFIVCTTKAQSYCVFGSKLTRILQEQGRPQIGKGWGKVKRPDCSGFTVDQFAQLDLSKMNFSEIYQDFISAAKLPDEAKALTSIQAKIQAYYKKGS